METTTRAPFRYPHQEAILRQLAAANNMPYEDVLDAPYGTDGFYIRKQAIGLASGEFVAKDGRVVCATCGGNCGQCGVTDTIGNVPFNFDTIVESLKAGRPALRVVGGRDIPLSEFGPEPGPEIIDESHYIKRRGIDWFMVFAVVYSAFYWGVTVILPLVLVVMSLAACSTVPERTRPPECITCVGPYDIGLTSHREALK